MLQVQDVKLIFLKKSYHMEKITVVKVIYYLLLFHSSSFSFVTNFFWNVFCLNSHIFFHSCP